MKQVMFVAVGFALANLLSTQMAGAAILGRPAGL